MRSRILAFTVAAALLGASPAFAAPTCQNVNGDATRCGTQGAMPVGWTLSPEQFSARQGSQSLDSSRNELPEAICIIAMLLALIALMPQFDGRRSDDWDKQEGDDKRRRGN